MGFEVSTSVIGEDPERGGSMGKVKLHHDGTMVDRETARGILTGMKHNLKTAGYEVVRGRSTGSFQEDNDRERTIESSEGGRVHAMGFTHRDVDLTGERFQADVETALQTPPPARSNGGRGMP